ncbi:hypothetical protein [Celerinatantimonas sp. MCCC 1A17872]
MQKIMNGQPTSFANVKVSVQEMHNKLEQWNQGVTLVVNINE